MNQEPIAQFCGNCGRPTVNGRCPVCEGVQPVAANAPQPQYNAPRPVYDQSDNEGRFIDNDERLIYQLGSGYLGTFLAGGGLTKNAAAVTNKRVYYKGKAFAALGVGLRRCKITQIIDLKDITCVGIYKAFNIALVIMAAFIFLGCLIGMIAISGAAGIALGVGGMFVSGLMVAGAFIGARTLLRIDYAGGCIALDIKSFSKKECEDFRLAIYREKDRITNYRG